MANNLHLDLFDAAGARQAVITDFNWLEYQARVNYPGSAKFGIAGDDPILAMLEPGWRMDIWRELPNGEWAREHISLIDGIEWTYTDRSQAVISASGPLSLLGKRRVAWYANTANRTAFTNVPAETISKTLVSYNAGPAATLANGRRLAGINSAISVETDLGRGNRQDWFCAWANLLETLQKLAMVGGGDFDLVQAGSGYQFKWFPGQRGTDRTASQVFSLERGNMADPVYKLSTAAMSNVVIVGGKGEDSARQIRIVQSAEYTAATQAEAFLDATDVDTNAGLDARGNAKLDELKSKRDFGFRILQTAAANYGVDYGLGDLVKAINPITGETLVVKIDTAQVSLAEDGALSIDIGVQ